MIENPQAFPTPEQRAFDGAGLVEGQPGMKLRDWFAGQAPKAPDDFFHPDRPTYKDVNAARLWNDENQRRWQLAVNAWIVAREVAWRSAYADAMLAARKESSQ